MRIEKFGELTAHVTGGTDREGGGDGPVVILLHGFGAPGSDLVSLWRGLDVSDSTRFVFPEAPLELDMGMADARAWWMVDFELIERAKQTGDPAVFTERVPEGIDDARNKVIALLDEVEKKLHVTSDKIVLGGFSQGAMLAADVVLRTMPRKYAGLVLMSGVLMAARQWAPLYADRKGLDVFQSHGSMDPLLPISLAMGLRDQLIAAGAKLRWIQFPGGHEIPWKVVEGLGRFITEVCA